MSDEQTQTLFLIPLITLNPLSAGRTVTLPHCDHETSSGSPLVLASLR